MTLLRAENIRHAFGTRPVLAGIDVAVAAGEVVGLIGPNGAGKTTLLRALAGLLTSDAGTIALDGTPVRTLDRNTRARAISYLAQQGETNWAVTVETLIGFGRLPHLGPWRGPSAADRDAIARALAACDVAHLAARPLNRLSGGERARVLLARALAVEPRVLLADEPVAGLDPAHALDVMAVLRSRARDGAGIIAVVHDLTIAARHCDRLVLLDDGAVVADGSPATVLTDANLARAYGIRALRGEAGGQPFIVPLARIAPPGAEERRP
jgi:iron complex transport system ATP-binding protein